MRLSTRIAALCAGLLVSHHAVAAELPQRWVSAGGALSEWVSAMGGESKLVGVDTTSQHPESLKALPSIGYQRQLSAEGVLSLRPQILVGTEEMGPPPVISQIRTAGVQVELFSAQPNLPTLQANLQHLGKLLGAEDKAARLFQAYQQQLDQQKVPGDQSATDATLAGCAGADRSRGRQAAHCWQRYRRRLADPKGRRAQSGDAHRLQTFFQRILDQPGPRGAGVCRPRTVRRGGACGAVQGKPDSVFNPRRQGRACHGTRSNAAGGWAWPAVARGVEKISDGFYPGTADQ